METLGSKWLPAIGLGGLLIGCNASVSTSGSSCPDVNVWEAVALDDPWDGTQLGPVEKCELTRRSRTAEGPDPFDSTSGPTLQIEGVVPGVSPAGQPVTLRITGGPFPPHAVAWLARRRALRVRVLSQTELEADFPGQPGVVAWTEVAVTAQNFRSTARSDLFSFYVETLPKFFAAPGAGGEPRVARLADLNGDGWTDVVTADQRDPALVVSYVLPSTTQGRYPTELKDLLVSRYDGNTPELEDHPWFSDMVLGKFFEEDGRVDAAVTHGFLGELWLLRNQGAGQFTQRPTVIPVGERLTSLAAADLDGDHHLDLVAVDAAQNQLHVLMGKGQGAFGAPSHSAVGASPQALVLADLNGDGSIDAAITNEASNDLSILFGNGRGGFSAELRSPTCTGPQSIAAADLDNDKEVDLVVACPSAGGVALHFGPSRTVPLRTQFLPVPYLPVGLAIADLDADKNLDIIVGNYQGRDIYVLRNQRLNPGQFELPVSIQAGYLPKSTSPISVATADLDHDGLPDIVTGDRWWGGIGLLLSQPQ